MSKYAGKLKSYQPSKDGSYFYYLPYLLFLLIIILFYLFIYWLIDFLRDKISRLLFTVNKISTSPRIYSCILKYIYRYIYIHNYDARSLAASHIYNRFFLLEKSIFQTLLSRTLSSVSSYFLHCHVWFLLYLKSDLAFGKILKLQITISISHPSSSWPLSDAKVSSQRHHTVSYFTKLISWDDFKTKYRKQRIQNGSLIRIFRNKRTNR